MTAATHCHIPEATPLHLSTATCLLSLKKQFNAPPPQTFTFHIPNEQWTEVARIKRVKEHGGGRMFKKPQKNPRDVNSVFKNQIRKKSQYDYFLSQTLWWLRMEIHKTEICGPVSATAPQKCKAVQSSVPQRKKLMSCTLGCFLCLFLEGMFSLSLLMEPLVTLVSLLKNHTREGNSSNNFPKHQMTRLPGYTFIPSTSLLLYSNFSQGLRVA